MKAWVDPNETATTWPEEPIVIRLRACCRQLRIVGLLTNVQHAKMTAAIKVWQRDYKPERDGDA